MKCKLCTFCIFDSPSNACLILSSQQPLGWATLCKLIWYSVQGRSKKREKWGTPKLLMFWEIHPSFWWSSDTVAKNRQGIDQDERQSMDCNKLHLVYMFNMKLQIPLLLEWGKQPKRTVHVYSEHDHNALLFLRDTWEEDGRALLIEWCWPAANQVPNPLAKSGRDPV